MQPCCMAPLVQRKRSSCDSRPPARRKNTAASRALRCAYTRRSRKTQRSTRRSRPTAIPSAQAAGRRHVVAARAPQHAAWRGSARPSRRRGHEPGVGGRREARCRRRRDGRVRHLPRAAAARGGEMVPLSTFNGLISLIPLDRRARSADIVVAADTLYEEAIARGDGPGFHVSRGACIVV